MDASAQTISDLLLAWYDDHARSLPWRMPPGSPPPNHGKDWPYRVWLSEVMLQQTTTAAVAPYFKKFTERWPTIEALAAADDADVMAAWAGLGYYARARNLLACAQAVTAMGGHFPRTEAELRQLPGLGAYTAAAVAAIAFGERSVVVDANVERVVSRLFAIEVPLPGSRPTIRGHAAALTPTVRPGDFAQAMMDLGAGVCTTRHPRCLLCPLSTHCAARETGDPARYPLKAAKKPKPQRKGQAFWIEQGRAVWLVKRPPRGMLGAMRALPDDGWCAGDDGHGVPPLTGTWASAGTVQYGFTHFDLELQLMLYSGSDLARLDGEGEWWQLDALATAGLPTLFAKAARLALARDQGE